ncbi:MAG TPA: pitrilysin family protein [bacterium]|nr:pitrilysin family protein [bacterium]
MHLKLLPLFGMLLMLGSTVSLAATFSKEHITSAKLDNGLKILLFEDHTIPNIAYFTFFRVGSRNERPGLTGVSHFIEHMMFNGTAQTGPGQLDKIMEFNGGSNNAYTSDDLTAYTDWFPAAALEKMMAIEADRMQGLAFVPEVLESERGVVASERRMSVENDNASLLDETVRATAIMAHPYHWSVIGWMSDIQNWRRDEIMAYYRTYYAPNNAVLVVVGDFSTTAILPMIKKYYGQIPASPTPTPVTTTEPEQIGPRRVMLHKPAQSPNFQMVWHAPACLDEDFPAMRVLEIALLHGESSRLYRSLVSDRQLAIDVHGGMQESLDPLLFGIYVDPRQEADPDTIEAAIETEIARIAAGGISEQELLKARNVIRTDFYRPQQSISGKANILGTAELLFGGWEELFAWPARFDTVTVAQVQNAAKKWLAPAKKTTGVLLPEEGGAE